MSTTTITRDQYLKMAPSSYLREGFRDAAGNLRPELDSIWATAGAIQLEAFAPSVLGTMLEALKQTLPLHEGLPPARIESAGEEAAEVTEGVLGRPLPPEMLTWLHQFTSFIESEQDLQDLLHLLNSVARLHAMFAGMRGEK